MSIRPLNDYVLIKPNEAAEKSAGGIILTAAKEKPTDGVVVAVGQGKLLENGTRRKPEVEAGVTVIFPQYGGVEVEVDGTKMRAIREDEILAIVAPKA